MQAKLDEIKAEIKALQDKVSSLENENSNLKAQITSKADNLTLQSVEQNLSLAIQSVQSRAAKAPKIESGTVSKKYYQTGHPIEIGTPFDSRSDIIHVNFSVEKFGSPPKVQVMLNSIDTEQSINTRIAVNPVNITTSGFDIQVKTWGDSKVYGVGITWLACIE